jgi:hypothetical protein
MFPSFKIGKFKIFNNILSLDSHKFLIMNEQIKNLLMLFFLFNIQLISGIFFTHLLYWFNLICPVA